MVVSEVLLMIRTTIMLPDELKMRALQHAHAHSQSLGQLIRESLERGLKDIPSKSSKSDSFWADTVVFKGPAPRDLSKKHDEYLYGDAG